MKLKKETIANLDNLNRFYDDNGHSRDDSECDYCQEGDTVYDGFGDR